MSEKVNMPVECLGEICLTCPELEIDVDHMILTDMVSEYAVNEIKCKHLSKCCEIYSMMKKDWEENHVRTLLRPTR